MNAFILVVFAAVALLAYGGLSLVFTEDRAVSRRLKGMTTYEAGEAKEAQPLLKPFRERIVGPVAETVTHFVTALGPRDYSMRLRQRLATAGTPGGLTAEGFVAFKVTGALFMGSLILIGAMLGSISFRTAIVLVPTAAFLGWLVPNLWLRTVRERRQLAVRRELPDMLDMLTISVEAGLGFDAALAKYIKNSESVLSEEFGRALQEVQAGAPRTDALRRVSERTDVAGLNSFVASMVQAEVLGTSIAKVLRTQSHEMRLRRRQHAEESAQKLPVKQVFPVVLCILPATLIVILGPAIIGLMRFFS